LERDLVYMRDRFNAPVEDDRSAKGTRGFSASSREEPFDRLPSLPLHSVPVCDEEGNNAGTQWDFRLDEL
jgi:hypothetical protein